MAQNTTLPKSLIEQILDDMFANLEAREEFDAQTVQGLRGLARRRGLTKPARVAEVIETDQRGVDEA